MTTGELLGLRAGLHGAPASRADAARQLGISNRRAARLEHRGLRALHAACGGGSSGSTSTGGAPARIVELASGAPALQPAVYLPASEAPTLRETADLDHPRGKQDVKDATAESPPASSSSDGPVAASVTPDSAITEDSAGNAAIPIIIAACLALLAALLLVGLRRRAVAGRSGAATITSASAALAPSRERPTPQPQPPAAEPTPPAPAGSVPPAATATTAAAAAGAAAKPGTEGDRAGGPASSAAGSAQSSSGRPATTVTATGQTRPTSTRDRAKRSASVVASGLVSLAVRELVRRRRGR